VVGVPCGQVVPLTELENVAFSWRVPRLRPLAGRAIENPTRRTKSAVARRIDRFYHVVSSRTSCAVADVEP
jgi:hypothetical protein